MIQTIRHRFVLVALAALAGLVVAASPAAATDDPAPLPGPVSQGGTPFGAPAAPAGVQAPATSPRRKHAAKKRVRVHMRYRKHRKGIRVSLTGPGLRGVKRVDVLVNGRRVARDSSRPFRVKVNGRKLGGSRKLQIRLVGSDGVRTITRQLRSSKRGGAAHRSAFESIATAISLNALLSRFGVV
jgi:hypothetical protein